MPITIIKNLNECWKLKEGILHSIKLHLEQTGHKMQKPNCSRFLSFRGFWSSPAIIFFSFVLHLKEHNWSKAELSQARNTQIEAIDLNSILVIFTAKKAKKFQLILTLLILWQTDIAKKYQTSLSNCQAILIYALPYLHKMNIENEWKFLVRTI